MQAEKLPRGHVAGSLARAVGFLVAQPPVLCEQVGLLQQRVVGFVDVELQLARVEQERAMEQTDVGQADFLGVE